ncbi:MAG: hypothetical protein V2A62_00850 [Candidatus Woesearchaeota archaeon]
MVKDIVSLVSPEVLFKTWSDPRDYDRFDYGNLQVGDYAVVANARPGAIYFLRTPDRSEPKDVFQGQVTMAHLLLGPNAGRGEEILRSLTRGYALEKKEGRDLDGVVIPFYLIG